MKKKTSSNLAYFAFGILMLGVMGAVGGSRTIGTFLGYDSNGYIEAIIAGVIFTVAIGLYNYFLKNEGLIITLTVLSGALAGYGWWVFSDSETSALSAILTCTLLSFLLGSGFLYLKTKELLEDSDEAGTGDN